MNVPRSLHTATLVPNGKVLVAGSVDQTSEIYDPATGAWTLSGSLTSTHLRHTATFVPDDRVLVVAGTDGFGNPSASAELYTPATGLWAPTDSLNTARYGQTTTLLANGTVLVAGGYGAAGTLSSAELYTSPPAPPPRPPVPVIEVSPLAHFPGDTNLLAIVPEGRAARVVFDGSKSYDPDGTPFSYAWYDAALRFSTNSIATRLLSLGVHSITLFLDDGFPQGTNSATVTVQVLSPSQAVGLVIDLVEDSSLAPHRREPLLASLRAAADSFDRGHTRPGLNQLRAFQNKVRAQVAPSAPVLARQLLEAAQTIIADAWEAANIQARLANEVEGVRAARGPRST